jgi:hypothetical protein
LRPPGYAVVGATKTTFYKNRFEMITNANEDAKECHKMKTPLGVTEQIKAGVQYPFADLLDKKDKQGADNSLEKGQLNQVDEDISRDAMVEKKLDNLIKDDYMKFDI